MKKLLTVLILFTIFPFTVYGQEDTQTSSLIPTSSVKAAEIEELDKKEEERKQEIANLLGFVLPEYTDNPSYVITFEDPSPDERGVEIKIDGNAFTTITSPYTFPALSIGEHAVEFRFYDKDSNVQLLEYSLVIIPRTPIISSPVLTDTSITIEGTALSNSEIIYTLSASAYNDSNTVVADENGNWSITITPSSGLTDDIYTFTAYTRKYGYASNLSSPITFGIGQDTQIDVNTNKKDIYFSFKDISSNNIVNIFKANTDLLILTGGVFLIGFFLAISIKSALDGLILGKKEKDVERVIVKQKKDVDSEGKTLREILSGDVSKNEKEPSIINKDVFLKKYKNLDPDTSEGKEKSSKSIKKKIKVSLTSKEE
mgnify:CR=1 FL=1